MTLKSKVMFANQVRRDNFTQADIWSCTTAARKKRIIPVGVLAWDTDLKQMFVGDGVQQGGISVVSNREPRLITNAAASAFTSNDTFKTIASAASGVYTSTAHGFAVGDQIIPMSTDATYKLTQDTARTIVTVPSANTFTISGDAPGDQVADVVVKKYSTSNNNYVTWAEGAYLRTGDGITLANGAGTLPSGFSNATEYFVVKDDTVANGGIDRNVTTKFKLSDSRAHALAGTDIITVRDAGSVGFTAVTTDMYATGIEDVVVVSNAVAVSFYLPTAVGVSGRQYTVKGQGGANCTVKSVAGTHDGTAAGTGVVLKASSYDYVTEISNNANWIIISKQVTP